MENYQIPLVQTPTGTTIGLDVTAVAARTSGSINNTIFHVATTTYTHFKFGDENVVADATCALMAPGERSFSFPAEYLSVVKAAGVSDGIIRITEVL